MSALEVVRESESIQSDPARQFSTFYLGGTLYGIDVMRVQEVTPCLPMTKVPLSPVFVSGLINLRGQISTAISLRALFQMGPAESQEGQMNVVCRVGELLFSFVVDKIGDVIELTSKDFEPTPDTLSLNIKKYMEGVYKIPGHLLSVIDVQKIADSILEHSRQPGKDRDFN